jgi:hypothetical protein
MGIMTRQLRPGQLRTGSLYDITSSFSLTASYAANANAFPFSGSAVITGSLLVSGSGITGSLFGTASFATTASYVNSLGSSNYSQSFSNSSTWTVTHNLGTRLVIIQAYDSGYDEVIPQNIDLTDDNTATITFPTLESGFVVASVGGTLSSGNTYITNTGVSTGSFATTSSNIFNGSQTIIGSVTSSRVLTDAVRFNTSAGVSVGVGELAWNNSDGTLDLGMKGGAVVQQIGQEIFYEVRNETGIQIPNGTAVFASGVTAGSGRITVEPYTADGSVREVRFLGLATENISTGVNGIVTHFGYVRGLDTRGSVVSSVAVGDETWAVGDILYVHPTVAGKLTNVKPEHAITVAIIITRHQSVGVLFVRPSSGGHLEDIHDILINTGSLTNGQVLSYNSTSGLWENTNQINTSSFATTASNNFIGTQTVTGSLNVTGSSTLNGNTIVSSPNLTLIQTITSASYAALTPVSGTLYIIIG